MSEVLKYLREPVDAEIIAAARKLRECRIALSDAIDANMSSAGVDMELREKKWQANADYHKARFELIAAAEGHRPLAELIAEGRAILGKELA